MESTCAFRVFPMFRALKFLGVREKREDRVIVPYRRQQNIIKEWVQKCMWFLYILIVRVRAREWMSDLLCIITWFLLFFTATKFYDTWNRLGWMDTFPRCSKLLNKDQTELVLWGLTLLKRYSKLKWVFSSHKDLWAKSGSDNHPMEESAQNVHSPFQKHKSALSVKAVHLEGRVQKCRLLVSLESRWTSVKENSVIRPPRPWRRFKARQW